MEKNRAWPHDQILDHMALRVTFCHKNTSCIINSDKAGVSPIFLLIQEIYYLSHKKNFRLGIIPITKKIKSFSSRHGSKIELGIKSIISNVFTKAKKVPKRVEKISSHFILI
ncbi:hypothetical protein BpHYR1_050772 [Brachionus plicatilis]|uniref:Uncharacterized protein n=1 Tax=Brachionus plicatilis TaxID=10195 RepID=A0A3M7P9R5_BRAPC|nr:hypothetical protein BpHYR1_050772 [Brachionus plicatilis]